MTLRGVLKAVGAVRVAAVAARLLERAGTGQKLEVTAPVVRLPSLPAAWDGARIAHWSDLHWLWKPPASFYWRAVDLCAAARPDLVVYTGDFIYASAGVREDLAELLRAVRAPLGAYAVLGNNDHDYGRGEAVRRLVESAGVEVLANRHVLLRRGGQELCLAGVDDLWHERHDLRAALSGVNDSTVRVLLCHNPDFAEVLPVRPRVDLMLCGHSHGGQVRLPAPLAAPSPIDHRRYMSGLVRGPRCLVYTSRGLGMNGPRAVRFRCRPELPLLTLRRA